MTTDEQRHSYRYLETLSRGREGERYLFAELSRMLVGTNLTINLATEDDHRVPFDLEILYGEKVLVGIENKDLSTTSLGTWIKGEAKRRKLAYAREQGIKVMLTTVTIRDTGRIGFCRGLANSHVMKFDFDRNHLLQEIREASA